MAEVTAVPAASVLVLRDAPLEVLMIRRTEQASFVPDAWVFPGGAVDEDDRALARELGDESTLMTMRIAAARELFEETGIWLGAPLADADAQRRKLLAGDVPFRELLAASPIDFTRLVWTSHWITPLGVPKRFDTYFFLTSVGRDVEAQVERNEAVDAVWIAPQDALARKKEMRMVFPTLRNLEAITGFATSDELMASRRGATIEAIQPVMVDGKIRLP